MTRYLSVEAVIAINAEHGGHGAGVRDAGIVAAQVHRPQHTFGGCEAHPSLWDKAAALLHGLARTQGFHDGNKRPAWIATRVFLEVNGNALLVLPPSTAHAVMLAISADLIDHDEIAEWLEEHAHSAASSRHPQLDYAFLAWSAVGDQDGTFNALRGGLHGLLHSGDWPLPLSLNVVCRMFWLEADVGRMHRLTVDLLPEEGEELLGGGEWEFPPPVAGGHPHHPNGLMPSIATVDLFGLCEQAGRYRVVLRLDEVEIATIPLAISAALLAS